LLIIHHSLLQIIAAVISRNIRGSSTLEDQCAWYGISYLIDTTLGLILAIVFLRILDRYANEYDWAHLKHSGVYTGLDGWKHWCSQVTAWMVILTVVKIIIYFFMWLFSDALAVFGGLLFEPFQSNVHFELLFVMIMFPGFLNVIYFWICDGYLKAGSEHADAHEPDALQDKKEALMDPTEQQQEQQQQDDHQPKAWTSLEVEPASGSMRYL
jgi:hypothetical protein